MAPARGAEWFLSALGHSTQRGYRHTHPFVGELRMGKVAVSIVPPELGLTIEIGDVMLTECQTANQFAASKSAPPQFTRGYGRCSGHADRKAMALVDRAVRAGACAVLAGPPAAGQSTLLRSLYGIDRIYRGRILIRHSDAMVDLAQTDAQTIIALRRGTLGYVLPFMRAMSRAGTAVIGILHDTASRDRIADRTLTLTPAVDDTAALEPA
ncbi:carbon-phosphorus lyase complex subunit PhnI [Acidiphilium sp. 37-64-53]|uniref:carbon-phosphorus lyase complex subunit PhnI n=1 Tax=unclassified Acidiphilium TaxID=2617493 RepID=UPI0026CE77A6